MTELETNPAAPMEREKTLTLTPSFWGGLSAAWLFTWRSRLTWRRLPMLCVSLLVLPTLIYITTFSAQTWSYRYPWIGRPPSDLSGFRASLSKKGLKLPSEKSKELMGIFEEEYERSEKIPHDGLTAEIMANRRIEELRACHQRVIERAKGVLDEAELAQFQIWLKRWGDQSLGRVAEPPWGRTGPFYHWLIDFYFFIILPLICVGGCGALIRDELQADTLSFWTTRPLSRPKLVIVKYLAQTGWLQIFLLVETLLVFTAGFLRDIPSLGGLLPLFLSVQILAVLAWSALGIFLGQLTQRYMAIALVYGLVVEMGIGRIPTNINTLSMMKHLKTLLAHNQALADIYEWTGTGVPLSIGALVCGTALFLTVAALMFTFREYHHVAEMQK